MSGWFKRYAKRQRELAQGADADLFSANNKLYKRAFALIGIGVLLACLIAKLRSSGVLHTILMSATIAAIVGGLVLLRWAGIVDNYLRKPDPEEPPSIFKP